MSKRINPNTKQNPILKINWIRTSKYEKKKKKKADLTQVDWWGGRWAAMEMLERQWRCMRWRPKPISPLSLSFSLSDVKHWNVLEVKKKIKRKGLCVLCGGEKQEKEKRKKEMKRGWKWNGRKKNNIKNKKS